MAFSRTYTFGFILVFLMGLGLPLTATSVKASDTKKVSPNSSHALPPHATTDFKGVLTYHNDNFRSGQNLNETILNTNNVNSTQFGKLFSYDVDGPVKAQPLYVPNLTIPSLGVHNVLYIVTSHDSVYAFDADQPNFGQPLWHVSYINPDAGITSVWSDLGIYEIGIDSTPGHRYQHQ